MCPTGISYFFLKNERTTLTKKNQLIFSIFSLPKTELLINRVTRFRFLCFRVEKGDQLHFGVCNDICVCLLGCVWSAHDRLLPIQLLADGDECDRPLLVGLSYWLTVDAKAERLMYVLIVFVRSFVVAESNALGLKSICSSRSIATFVCNLANTDVMSIWWVATQ